MPSLLSGLESVPGTTYENAAQYLVMALLILTACRQVALLVARSWHVRDSGSHPDSLSAEGSKRDSFLWSGQVRPVDLPLPPPIKYRPFKWGAYHVTMALQSSRWQDWVTLDRDFVRYFTLRRWRMAQSGSDSVRLLPSPDGKNVLAAKELAREVGAYLAAKYPALFVYHPGLPLSGYTGSLDVEQRGKDIPELVLTDAYLSAVQRDTSAPRAEVSTISFSKESEVGMDTKAHVRDERKIKMRFPLGTAEDCLEMIGSVVPDDVLLLLPSPDRGQEYVLIGGVTCTAGTWRLKDKIGMTLTEIHTSGHVPQYETKLRPGMDKFFARLQPDNLMARSNVGFQVIRNRPSVDPEELAHLPYVQGDPDVAEMSWATTAFGPENEWVHENRGKGVILAQSTGELSRPGQDPTEQTFSSSASQFQLSSQPASRVPVEEKVEAVEGDLSFDPTPFTRMEVFASATEEEQEKFVEHVQMRTERQSVRRLPLSGAVIFTVHTYVVPVLTMAQEWGVPARLSSALKSWPEDTFKYKGGPKYRDQLVTYLDRKHAHQLAKGLVVDKEKDRASYPL